MEPEETIEEWRKKYRDEIFKLPTLEPFFKSEKEKLRCLFGIEVDEETALSVKDKTDELIVRLCHEDIVAKYPSMRSHYFDQS